MTTTEINLDRARQIGRMLIDIDKALDEAQIAYSNHAFGTSRDGVGEFFYSQLFEQLGAQRDRLRTELRNMG